LERREPRETKTLGIVTAEAALVEGISVKSADAALEARVVRVDEKNFQLHVTPRAVGVFGSRAGGLTRRKSKEASERLRAGKISIPSDQDFPGAAEARCIGRLAPPLEELG
jgi:hypothetical protein